MNYELLLAMVRHIVTREPAGAVLVFMSGLMEITKLYDLCRQDTAIRETTGGVPGWIHRARKLCHSSC